MTAQKKAPAKAGDVVQRPTGMAAIAQFQELVTTVPEAQDGDGIDIIARVLTAGSIEELAEDDGLPSSKDLAPFSCHVQSVSRRPSDHPSNTGFYLIVDAVSTHGEAMRFSAGGEQTIAMLAKLNQLGALPCQVMFEKVTTKGGREAVNCRPILSTANGRRD
jgi:hypothetical protein